MEEVLPETRALEALADTMWSERRVVEFLLFKLVTAKLILAADEKRFVVHAMDEVERGIDKLRLAEAERAAAVSAIASVWRIDPASLTLGQLVERAPEPLRSVFRELQDSFLELTAEIEHTAAANRELADSGLEQVQVAMDALLAPAEGPATYTAAGREDRVTPGPLRLDQAL